MIQASFIGMAQLVPLVLFALGVSQVITGSKIGYPIRFVFCLVTWRLGLKSLWGLVQCPYCNAWWSAAFIALVYGFSPIQAVQAAFTTCGVMATINAFIGGNGLAAAEDFEIVFSEMEKE